MAQIAVQKPLTGGRFRVTFKSTRFTPCAVPAFTYGIAKVHDDGLLYVATVPAPEVAMACAQVAEMFPGAVIRSVSFGEADIGELLSGHSFRGTVHVEPESVPPPSIWARIRAYFFGVKES